MVEYPNMTDLTRVRARETEAAPALKYDRIFADRQNFVQQGFSGTVVVKENDREWEMNRQGFCKYILLEKEHPDTSLQDWWVFVHDIRKQSGKHRHQGGLVLFVLEGQGATECNGEMIEWEEGDCILLPFHPDGVEHQHFNRGDKPAKWLAFIHIPTWNHVASELAQVDVNPEFKQR
jgi:mannose-6-phosphate isomerase-like protein (cupin superfamily)